MSYYYFPEKNIKLETTPHPGCRQHWHWQWTNKPKSDWTKEELEALIDERLQARAVKVEVTVS